LDELSKMAGGREVKLGTCEPRIEFDEVAEILCSSHLNTDDVSVVRLGGYTVRVYGKWRAGSKIQVAFAYFGAVAGGLRLRLGRPALVES